MSAGFYAPAPEPWPPVYGGIVIEETETPLDDFIEACLARFDELTGWEADRD